jgi:hypothetical protein
MKPRIGEPGELALELEGIEQVLRCAHVRLKMTRQLPCLVGAMSLTQASDVPLT